LRCKHEAGKRQAYARRLRVEHNRAERRERREGCAVRRAEHHEGCAVKHDRAERAFVLSRMSRGRVSRETSPRDTRDKKTRAPIFAPLDKPRGLRRRARPEGYAIGSHASHAAPHLASRARAAPSSTIAPSIAPCVSVLICSGVSWHNRPT